MIHFYQRTNNLTEEISEDNFFPFAEIITIKNLRVIGSKSPTLLHLYYDFVKDLENYDKVDYSYSDAFDILQEVASLLYQNKGKKLSDIIYTYKDKTLSLNQMCNRIVNQMTYRRRQYEFYTCPIIDNKDSEEFSYELENNNLEEENAKVDKLIESFNLEPIEKEILNCLMANIKHKDIVSLLNCNHSRPWNLKLKLQRKLVNMII